MLSLAHPNKTVRVIILKTTNSNFTPELDATNLNNNYVNKDKFDDNHITNLTGTIMKN